MDLDHLRAFMETARRGSFSLAAEALNLSQPAVSRRIGRLEAELGRRLLERGRPVVTPTRAGLALLAFAERTLAEWDRLLPSLPAGEELAGVLHIAASSAPAEAVLPMLLADFCRLHPGVQTQLHVMNSDTVEECVRRHHCDVGFLGRPPRSPLLQQVPVAQDEVALAVPAGHPWASREAVEVAELTGERFVAREAGSGTWDAAVSALAVPGLPPLHLAAEVTGARAQLAAIAAGQGVGFVSLLLAERARSEGVVLVRLREHHIRRTLHMLYDERRIGRLVQGFVAFVRARAVPGAADTASPPC